MLGKVGHPALSPRINWAGTGRSAQANGASGGGRLVGRK